VITRPYNFGYYGRTNILLLRKAQADLEAIMEDWQDDASEAAIEGNPQKAQYIEYMIKRHLG
jgi:hypothetical protein